MSELRQKRMLLILVLSALSCLALSIFSGFLGVLYYVPEIASFFLKFGVSLQQLRPLHTSFASAWLFLACVSMIWKYFFDNCGPLTSSDIRHWRFQLATWVFSGIGIFITLPFGLFSGREYLGFHPFFSLLIYGGWLSFAWVFFKKIKKNFWSQPVYVFMWATGVFFFLYTFAEGHFWLFTGVLEQPVADLQIQWKSCGTLVASFNQMVYGCLFYLSEKISGDKNLARSKKAFLFFCIGLLNSFTNYAHHTYHLPQSHLIKWISFIVSMLEIAFLYGILVDIVKIVKEKSSFQNRNPLVYFLELSKCWNLFLLSLAILISIPPLNALIHGTHVVMAHAMGSEIAIDTYILFAVMLFLFPYILPRDLADICAAPRRLSLHIFFLNLFLIALVSILTGNGLLVGLSRLGVDTSSMDYFSYYLAFTASFFGFFLALIVGHWLFFLFRQLGKKERL
jgi:nitric oxide reductase subunit B